MTCCPEIPACSRNRTYVFLIDGIDPLCEMDVLREGLIEAGFIKIYSGPRPWCCHYAKEIQRLHLEDEDARFVIVSQGSASGAARTIAELAGTPIDLVVLLDETGEGPVHAEHVLFICGEKDAVKIWDGAGRAAEVAMASLLHHLGVLPSGQLDDILHPPVRNVVGLLVGEMRPAKSWLG